MCKLSRKLIIEKSDKYTKIHKYLELDNLTKLKIMFFISPFEERFLVFKIATRTVVLMSPYVITMFPVLSKQLSLFLFSGL